MEPLVARLQYTVGMSDVDLVQIDFVVYFRWMERAHEELLRLAGHPMSGSLRAGFAGPVVDARCTFAAPVSVDDDVTAVSWFERSGRSSYVIAHRFEHDGRRIAEGEATHVWIRRGTPPVPTPVPGWLAAAVLPGRPA